MTEKTCIIYGLAHTGDPSTIRYIGQTKGPLLLRLRSHLNQSKSMTRQSPLAKWIRAHRTKGDDILIHSLQENAPWNTAEMEWIKNMRATGNPILNITAGGDGNQGASLPKHVRDKISAALKGKKKPEGFGAKVRQRMLGSTMSSEHKERLRQLSMQRPMSDKEKDRLRAAMLGNTYASFRKWTPEQRTEHAARVRATWAARKAVITKGCR